MSGGIGHDATQARALSKSTLSKSIVPFALGVFAIFAWSGTPAASAAGVFSAGSFLAIVGLGLIALSIGVIYYGQIIHNPRDYFGGLALLGIALVAVWASKDLPGMRGFAFGPGTAPRMFAIALGVLGIVVSMAGMLTRGPAVERFHLRGPVFVTAALFIFAATIRPLGLIIASFCAIMAASAASKETRWVEAVIWGAFLTAFVSILFPYGLNLPFQLWPRF